MQLDAFLTTVTLWAPDAFDPLFVLYRATAPAFSRAYDLLREERPYVTWIEERSFRDDLLEALAGNTPGVVFHTDDDVFFDGVPAFELREDEVCFSLRLGLNTTYCYPLDLQERLEAPRVEPHRVSWSWREQPPGAYSYPLALNGHVFRADEARDWMSGLDYANPNELEAALQALLEGVRTRMASFPTSRVVSIPANIVNETFPNRHAGLHDVAELNERFLAGERIDVAAMNFARVDACHVEIPYLFVRPDHARSASSSSPHRPSSSGMRNVNGRSG